MQNYTAADLQRLATGRAVPGDVFRAILADPRARDELNRLVQVRDLLDAGRVEGARSEDVADMDVTFDELARYGEQQSLAPERRAAVERFLAKHYPEALAKPAPRGDAGR
jgi:hypothetical protein